MFHRCKEATHPRDFSKAEHFDLLLRIWKVLHSESPPSIQVQKIKAHLNPLEESDLHQRYNLWGNALADRLAGQAAAELSGDLAQRLRSKAVSTQLEHDQFKLVYDCLVAQANARMSYLDGVSAKPEISEEQQASQEQYLLSWSQWMPCQPRPATCHQMSDTSFDHFSYGPGLGRALAQWMKACTWPDVSDQSHISSQGASWIELVAGFMASYYTWIPVFRPYHGTRWVHLPQGEAEARSLQITWAELGNNFQCMIQQLRNLSKIDLWPEIPTGRTTSPLMLGGPARAQGVQVRPMFPGQHVAVQMFQSHFSEGSRSNYQCFPEIPWPSQHQSVVLGDSDLQAPAVWAPRLERAKYRQRQLRKKAQG